MITTTTLTTHHHSPAHRNHFHHHHRHVKPWGVAGGGAAALPVSLIMVAMVYYSATSGDVVLGIKHAKIIGLLVIVSVGVSLTSLPPRPKLRWAGPG
jgi:hypothetical protein